MTNNALPRLYLITDGLITGGLQTGEGEAEEELLTKIKAALAGGVRLIQLREKQLKARQLLRLAKKLRGITRDYGASLLINDRVDIALACDADGVHLTVASFSPKDARRLLGKGKLIACSTHDAEQALQAQAGGADFITLGPIFHTPSKAAYGEPLGLESFREITKKIQIPVFALGGVKKNNVKEVRAAGAYGSAIISEIMAANKIKETTEKILNEIR